MVDSEGNPLPEELIPLAQRVPGKHIKYLSEEQYHNLT